MEPMESIESIDEKKLGVMFEFAEEVVRNDTNLTRAAALVGAPRTTLWWRVHRYLEYIDPNLYHAFREKMNTHKRRGGRKKVT